MKRTKLKPVVGEIWIDGHNTILVIVEVNPTATWPVVGLINNNPKDKRHYTAQGWLFLDKSVSDLVRFVGTKQTHPEYFI